MSGFELGRDELPCRSIREMGVEYSIRISYLTGTPVNWPFWAELCYASFTPPGKQRQLMPYRFT